MVPTIMIIITIVIRLMTIVITRWWWLWLWRKAVFIMVYSNIDGGDDSVLVITTMEMRWHNDNGDKNDNNNENGSKNCECDGYNN